MPDPPQPRLPGHDAPLGAGEQVVLVDRKDRRRLVTLTAGGEWHSHAGVLAHDDVIGRPEGSELRTSGGMAVVVLRPTRADYVLKMGRGAQVVYPKDQALIVSLGDIRPGCTVVEAGAGSGALTLALLDAVGAAGRVISYEHRDDHLEVARRNVTRFHGGAPANWELHHGDVAEGLAGRRCDRVVLDLLRPWDLVGAVAAALSPGGILTAFTATVPQVIRLCEGLAGDGRFAMTATVEALVRGWTVDGLSVRPDHRMVAHTGFVTTSRRVPGPDEGGPRRRPRHSGLRWTDDG